MLWPLRSWAYWARTGVGWGERQTDIQRTSQPYLIIKILLCWNDSLMSIHVEHKCHHIFLAIQRELFTCPFPRFPCHQFSSPNPSKSLTILPNHWPQSTNWYVITCLAISLAKQNEQAGGLLKVLPIGNISLHHVLPGCSRKGLLFYKRFTFRCLHTMTNHLQTRPKAFFPSVSQLKKSSCEAIDSNWEREDTIAGVFGPLFSDNSVLLPGPACACFLVYCFHFMM